MASLLGKRKQTQRQKEVERIAIHLFVALVTLVSLRGNVRNLKGKSLYASVQEVSNESTVIVSSSNENVVKSSVVLEMINHRKNELSAASIRYCMCQDPQLDNQQCRDNISKNGRGRAQLVECSRQLTQQLQMRSLGLEQRSLTAAAKLPPSLAHL